MADDDAVLANRIEESVRQLEDAMRSVRENFARISAAAGPAAGGPDVGVSPTRVLAPPVSPPAGSPPEAASSTNEAAEALEAVLGDAALRGVGRDFEKGTISRLRGILGGSWERVEENLMAEDGNRARGGGEREVEGVREERSVVLPDLSGDVGGLVDVETFIPSSVTMGSVSLSSEVYGGGLDGILEGGSFGAEYGGDVPYEEEELELEEFNAVRETSLRVAEGRRRDGGLSSGPPDATSALELEESISGLLAFGLPEATEAAAAAVREEASRAVGAGLDTEAVAEGAIVGADLGAKRAKNVVRSYALGSWRSRLEGVESFPDETTPVAVRAAARAVLGMAGAEGEVATWKAAWPVVEPVDERGRAVHHAAFNLRVVYEAGRTGFEDEKEFHADPGAVVAGRFEVRDNLGGAVFSSAVACTDLATGQECCLKVVKNKKDFVDQSLDEIKLLKYLNSRGRRVAAEMARRRRRQNGLQVDDVPEDILVAEAIAYAESLVLESDANVGDAVCAAGVLRLLQLHDYMYYKEHLFIVTELLKDNLYEFQKWLSDRGHEAYFTIPRIQLVARQVLEALAFVHGLGVVHCDLKPENILIESYSRCRVKVIDFGSSCFVTDHLSSYIQSRSYRAPEVILGLAYGPKIDVWSLGCILCELLTEDVLFVNDSVPVILARMQSLLGPFPDYMLDQGRETDEFFLPDRSAVFDAEDPTAILLLKPKPTSLRQHLGPQLAGDAEFCDFLECLLQLDPRKRPSAVRALTHPFLRKHYDLEPFVMPDPDDDDDEDDEGGPDDEEEEEEEPFSDEEDDDGQLPEEDMIPEYD